MDSKLKLKNEKDSFRDIFQRLGIQLTNYWSGVNDQSNHARSTEYVDILEAIENFVFDIQVQKIPTLARYLGFLKSRNFAEIKKIETYFRKLKFDNNSFSCPEVHSKRVEVFLEQYRNLEISLIAKHHLDDEVNPHLISQIKNGSKRDLAFILKKSPELLFQLIDNIKTDLETDATKINIRERRNIATTNQNTTTAYVDNCFNVCPQIFVVCMDLGYQPIVLGDHNVSHIGIQSDIDQALTQTSLHWFELRKQLGFSVDIVGHCEKLEYSALKGISLHCAFFCRNQKEYTEKYWGNLIGSIWNNITQGQGIYYNCNPEIRENFSIQAVGLIRASDKTKKRALQRWIIDYIALSSQYLSISVPEGQRTFLIGKTPNLSSIVHQGTQKNETISNNANSYTLREKDIKECWKVTANNLSPKLAASLKDAPLIYNELKEILKNKDTSLPHDLVDISELNVEKLIKIEKLVTFIRDSQGLAFDPKKRDHSNTTLLTEKDLEKRITRIGKQILDIGLKFNVAFHNGDFNSYLKYFSVNLKIFFDVLHFQPVWERVTLQPQDPIQNKMNFYNEFVRQIRTYLNGDVQRIAHLIPTRLPDHSLKPKTIKALLAEQNRIANNSFNKTSKYVQEIFNEDVTLLSLKFFIHHDTHDIPLEIFSLLFTTFLHFGQNCRPLCWSRGYIGRWEYTQSNRLCARVTFFLNTVDVEKWTDINLVQQVEDYWAKIVQEKKPKLKNLDWQNYTNLKGIVETRNVFNIHPDFNDYLIKIQSQEKKKQKDFIQQVVMYLTKSDLYFNPNLIDLPKAPIQGNAVRQAKSQESIKKAPDSGKTKSSNFESNIIKTVTGSDSIIVDGDTQNVVIDIPKKAQPPHAMKLLTWVPDVVSDRADNQIISADNSTPLTHTESEPKPMTKLQKERIELIERGKALRRF